MAARTHPWEQKVSHYMIMGGSRILKLGALHPSRGVMPPENLNILDSVSCDLMHYLSQNEAQMFQQTQGFLEAVLGGEGRLHPPPEKIGLSLPKTKAKKIFF